MITPDIPLISCIMPTRNRPQFLQQAIRSFLSQDYPHKELIIVDCSDEPTLLAEYPGVRSVSITEPLSIGMMRNIACSLAQGNIIVHQDDDDYYGPHRLSRQAEPIIQGRAEVTALKMSLLLDVPTGKLYACPTQVHAKLFPYDARAGTMMYLAQYWHSEGFVYPNRSKGEDVSVLSLLLSCHARLERITDPSSYICVRHGSNVTDGLDVSGWIPVPLADYLSETEQAFYASLAHERAAV